MHSLGWPAGWGSVGPGGLVGHGCRSFIPTLIAQDAGVCEYLITDQDISLVKVGCIGLWSFFFLGLIVLYDGGKKMIGKMASRHDCNL